MQIQEIIDEHGRRGVRVPLMLADSGIAVDRVQQQVAHDQVVRDYAKQRGVSESQAAYEMRLGDAWKTRPQPVAEAPQPHFGGAAPVAPAPTADHGQSAYEARLRDAWRGQAA